MGWPDHGVPEGKAVLDFELMLNYFIGSYRVNIL